MPNGNGDRLTLLALVGLALVALLLIGWLTEVGLNTPEVVTWVVTATVGAVLILAGTRRSR